ncbi:Hypothetical predicted protein [Olea europaea subsp. europaea]|uniref:Uncharacterized protein n=1 Tax=Olea europaea subsp. europaea TaxID=158383 RepID=A0A8S0Q9X3_OLEEU|nr:Hypothetical predicted protein [Olea europaea subsp. europaea]
MDRLHHVSEALSILYNSEKIRALNARYDKSVQVGIKIMPELRYLKIRPLNSSIGKLHNLEFLFVSNIREIPAYYLNMPKLRHLRVAYQILPRKASIIREEQKNFGSEEFELIIDDSLVSTERLRSTGDSLTFFTRMVRKEIISSFISIARGSQS